MTNKEFKKEYEEFKGLIAKYPMLNEAFVKLPNLIKFTIFLEKKLGIIGTESLFRIISTMHYEYNNIVAELGVIADEKQRDYVFQCKNVEIWNSVCNQIYNSISMVSVLGDRDDAEYIRMANDKVANIEYFNVYYSLVKYQMNSKVGDRWNEVPASMRLYLTMINNFDDDFKMNDFIGYYFQDVDSTTKVNPDLLNESNKDNLENLKLFYAAMYCGKYIYEIDGKDNKND